MNCAKTHPLSETSEALLLYVDLMNTAYHTFAKT